MTVFALVCSFASCNVHIDVGENSDDQSTVSKDYSKASDEELLDVCKQFEAYFMEQVFKQMEKTIIKDESSSGSSTALVDYFKDSALQELTKTSTETQGLGIAQALYEQMKRNYGL